MAAMANGSMEDVASFPVRTKNVPGCLSELKLLRALREIARA